RENAQETDARNGVSVLETLKVGQVVACGEVSALTAQHDNPDSRVPICRQQRLAQLRVGRRIQRITALRAVDADQAHAVIPATDQDAGQHQDRPTTGITAPWMALARSDARKPITSAS